MFRPSYWVNIFGQGLWSRKYILQSIKSTVLPLPIPKGKRFSIRLCLYMIDSFPVAPLLLLSFPAWNRISPWCPCLYNALRRIHPSQWRKFSRKLSVRFPLFIFPGSPLTDAADLVNVPPETLFSFTFFLRMFEVIQWKFLPRYSLYR